MRATTSRRSLLYYLKPNEAIYDIQSSSDLDAIALGRLHYRVGKQQIRLHNFVGCFPLVYLSQHLSSSFKLDSSTYPD